MKYPNTDVPCVMIMAHTHGAVRIATHGTWLGFFFDVLEPIASSISRRSSAEMRGCLAGVSNTMTNHRMDQTKPIPPGNKL